MKKMKSTVKFLCALLCLCLVCSIVISCAPEVVEETEFDDVSVGTDESDPTLDENGYLRDSLDGKYYDGKEVKILSWENNPYLFPVESPQEDPVMSLIYSRDRYVEERLGVEFSVTRKTSNASSDKTVAMALYNVVASGSEEIDVVASYSLYPPLMAYNGLLYDLNTLDYPETDKPWYPKNLEQWEVYDRLFYVTGNSAKRTFDSMHVMYANTKLLEENGITDLIPTVLDGKWTLEKLQTYVRNWQSAAADNPDPTYGLLWTFRTSMDAFYYGAGFNSTLIDNEGLPQLAYNNATYIQRIDDFISTVRTMMNSPECHILQTSSTELMKAHKTVFYAGGLGNVKDVAGDEDISVIPYPKLNEDQTDYITLQDNAYDVWGVPFTAGDPQLGAVMIEAMMSSDYRMIGPDYFDRNLKYRYSNSDEGVQMFEIIRASLSTDFGRINQKTIGSSYTVEGLIRDCVYPWTNAGADGPVYTGEGFSTKLAASIDSHQKAISSIHKVYKS